MCKKCQSEQPAGQGFAPHCCPTDHAESEALGFSRRAFVGGMAGAALGSLALAGCSWSRLASRDFESAAAPPRRPLAVQPLLLYTVYTPRPQSSWRNWGGIQNEEQAHAETTRINGELGEIERTADFPLDMRPLAAVRSGDEAAGISDIESADALIVYAAGGGTHDLNRIAQLKKDTILFVRHRSGPVYLWYEIVSPRFLRQHTDAPAVPGIEAGDVVVDSLGEVTWRLRALCGLKNTRGSRILTIGGAGAWAQPGGVVPDLVRDKWGMEMPNVPYEDLGRLIQEARADSATVRRGRERAATYLAVSGTTLETEKSFVENAFVLEEIFVRLMQETDCRAITINGCMGTIMPLAETSACLTLSLLNDRGYLAFCESDFVVIPSGILLASISGKPAFLNDPTFPHDGVITLAHCTAPRRMDGRNLEPTRILTHFESDYGAAPKVEMAIGQTVTNAIPDFKSERWVGLRGTIQDHPFLPICRSQIDIEFDADSQRLAERMPGFHWMTVYGDYMRETGYALRRIPIAWDCV